MCPVAHGTTMWRRGGYTGPSIHVICLSSPTLDVGNITTDPLVGAGAGRTFFGPFCGQPEDNNTDLQEE